jgi:hypothetical protein
MSETTAENPFLPDGRQWAWSSTTLGLAKECKRKYYYAQILGYRNVGNNPHIIFGHALCEGARALSSSSELEWTGLLRLCHGNAVIYDSFS